MLSYFMPVKCYFGHHCLNNLSQHILGKKALIVSGQKSARLCGALADVIAELGKANTPYHVYAEITENPSLISVNKGAGILKAQKCDFIIAIGGGSPIDAAKAIAVVAANNMEATDIYNASLIKKAYPLIAIPTTSGTGTEVTPYSVITDTVNMKKAGFGNLLIYPKVSFMDPHYTLTLPFTQTRDTAVDALSHLLEGIYSNSRNPLVYPYIYAGIQLIIDKLPLALANPDNLDYRTHLMQAAFYGGVVIAQTGTTLQHSIGYPLTSEYNVSHGLANGLVMQDIMDLYYPLLASEIDSLFANLSISREIFYEWLAKLDLNINFCLSDEFIKEKPTEVLKSRNMAKTPGKITSEIIENIYRKCQK